MTDDTPDAIVRDLAACNCPYALTGSVLYCVLCGAMQPVVGPGRDKFPHAAECPWRRSQGFAVPAGAQ